MLGKKETVRGVLTGELDDSDVQLQASLKNSVSAVSVVYSARHKAIKSYNPKNENCTCHLFLGCEATIKYCRCFSDEAWFTFSTYMNSQK
jgi:hypothetical protein